MKRKALQALAAVAVLGGLVAGHGAQAAGDLFIYNWTDYTSPDLIKKFEQESGIKVTLDTYDSNETLLAKLKSGSSGYDIVVVSSDFVPIFAKEGVIQKIDAPKLAGYANIMDRWKSPVWDKDNQYTIPYDWGVTSYSVNTKQVKAPADSLKLLFEPPPEAKGKIGMFGSPSEVMSLAEVYLGMTPCQTDVANMKKVSELLEGQAPFVKVYNSDGIIDRQSSGETWIHEVWNGDSARARVNNPDIKFVFPKEGVVGWMDNVAVPTSAKDPENAKKFIEFLLKPENSGLSSNFTHYASAVTGADAYFDANMKDAPELKVPADEKIAFTPACPEEATKLMDRVWTKLKK
ncbi:extracellular solute-binding protein [Lichenifustis flavocetrariae]|uniref:Putrescine-binding periplasmic protein n=1 Tax=Lichenifustis flavocetrariae TaxID=2949735 RepID=A0AA41YTW0_9HYPH|nr:extracellular solute-binding protein [Lichenifustis flavocetrariae]MCW6507230.1 extracellular solute-binding protein [Lichenifustis flavocetrariae]